MQYTVALLQNKPSVDRCSDWRERASGNDVVEMDQNAANNTINLNLPVRMSSSANGYQESLLRRVKSWYIVCGQSQTQGIHFFQIMDTLSLLKSWNSVLKTPSMIYLHHVDCLFCVWEREHPCHAVPSCQYNKMPNDCSKPLIAHSVNVEHTSIIGGYTKRRRNWRLVWTLNA